MIHEIDANLLEYPLDGIIHSANCMLKFGAGIALQIQRKFPQAYEADLKTVRGDNSKLGTFSLAVLPSNFHIYNMYGQFGFGMGRQTSYDAFADGLNLIEAHASKNGLKKIGLPKYMGSRLGGGSWPIVHAIIESIFKESLLELYICNYMPK